MSEYTPPTDLKEIQNASLERINEIVMDSNWSNQLTMRACFDRALELGYDGGFPISLYYNLKRNIKLN